MKTHYFTSTSEAYDASQCDDSIKDGDILVATDENVVGILAKAWPVAVTDRHGSFHTPAGDSQWPQFDGMDYTESVREAKKLIAAHAEVLADMHREAGESI